MTTANATRPKFGEPWEQHGNMISRAGGGTIGTMALGLCPRTIACVNALADIANPSTIPALIEAARHIAKHGYHGVGEDESLALVDAIAALDAEPVA